MISESEGRYFSVLGLRGGQGDSPGRFMAYGYEVLGHKAMQAILKIPGVRERFITDNTIHEYSRNCEAIATILCRDLLSQEVCKGLSQKFENDSAHGWDHIRRTKKWKKWIDRTDHTLRRSLDYLYFQLGSFFSLRLHDIFQVFTGLKEGHDSAGALFAFGYLRENYNQANTLMLEDEKIPQEDWDNQVWATAYMIRHHSKPDDMPHIDNLLQNGVLNLKQILADVEAVAQKQNKTIHELFPLFSLIKSTIEAIRRGEFDHSKQSSQERLEAIKMQTYMVSSADKLDSNFPADLSAARTVLARPDRPFFIRVEEGLSLEEELSVRISDGRGDNPAREASCDLNRWLFELTRTEEYAGKSAAVSAAFGIGLRQRTMFFEKAIPAFVGGDIEPHMRAYDDLEIREIKALLTKIGAKKDSIRAVGNLSVHQMRHDLVRGLLKKHGYKEETVDWVLYRIHTEKEAVREALERKREALNKFELTSEEKQRIADLLKEAIVRQKSSLRFAPGANVEGIPPYQNYFYINLQEWKTTT